MLSKEPFFKSFPSKITLTICSDGVFLTFVSVTSSFLVSSSFLKKLSLTGVISLEVEFNSFIILLISSTKLFVVNPDPFIFDSSTLIEPFKYFCDNIRGL